MLKIGIECESIEGKNPIFGVGRMVAKLLEELSRRPELEENYRFILYFKDNVPELPFLKAPIFEIKRVPVPFFKNRLFPIYYFALLPIQLWFDRPDMMFWPNYMLPIIAFGKSLVALTEDVHYETHTGKLPFRYRLAYGIFGWWTAKFADKIMAISETSKRNLAKLYNINPSRIIVNYLGVDIGNVRSVGNDGNEKTNPTSEAIQQAKQSNNSNYLLFVGQMFPRRHAKETILAFEKLTEEFPRLRLVAIGPDKYPEPTINLLVSKVNKELDYEAVIYKEYVSNEELTKLYGKAEVLVYVSEREAFGLPPMEALSFGVPPVIADNELGYELFGGYAFYSKSGGVDDIAETIKRALTENQKIDKIKSEGPEFVKKYNWKSFADRFIENLE